MIHESRVPTKSVELRAPQEADVRAVVASRLGSEAFEIRRYPTGLCHYVYEVTPFQSESFVLRMARSDLGHLLKSAQFWSDTLRPLGVPLPETLEVNFAAPFPYMLLKRLDGEDLGAVYPRLRSDVRRSIAKSVASWQSIAASLPEARGFGYGASFDDPALLPSWTHVLEAQLDRTRGWMKSGGVGELTTVDRVQERLYAERAYLEGVAPRPFLHDTTTKNVLVSEAGAHGLVDVDDVCFGDRLFVLSLTKMAFISSKFDEEYIRFWEEAWQLRDDERRIVQLYTAAHCAGFISELGMQFNKEGDVKIDPERKAFLEGTFERLLG